MQCVVVAYMQCCYACARIAISGMWLPSCYTQFICVAPTACLSISTSLHIAKSIRANGICICRISCIIGRCLCSDCLLDFVCSFANVPPVAVDVFLAGLFSCVPHRFLVSFHKFPLFAPSVCLRVCAQFQNYNWCATVNVQVDCLWFAISWHKITWGIDFN